MMKRLSQAETREQLDARGIETSLVDSFAYLDRDENIRYDWHAHSRHQLMYAFSGTLRLEAENGLYLLPPQRAAWIPAGVKHRTTLHNVRSGSVFFAPALVAADTGGGIKGAHIDICYDDGEPITWDSRTVQIYFLSPAPPADKIRHLLNP